MLAFGRSLTSLALWCLVLCLLYSCEPASRLDTKLEEGQPATSQGLKSGTADLGPNAAIIRNPVDQGTLDTINVAKLTFSEVEHPFGEVRAGRVVRHEFDFRNGGKVPLLITNARSTCGCTVADYPGAAIPPGGSGVIKVTFDTQNKGGYQKKPIQLTANTYPATTTIYLTGRVNN